MQYTLVFWSGLQVALFLWWLAPSHLTGLCRSNLESAYNRSSSEVLVYFSI